MYTQGSSRMNSSGLLVCRKVSLDPIWLLDNLMDVSTVAPTRTCSLIILASLDFTLLRIACISTCWLPVEPRCPQMCLMFPSTIPCRFWPPSRLGVPVGRCRLGNDSRQASSMHSANSGQQLATVKYLWGTRLPLTAWGEHWQSTTTAFSYGWIARPTLKQRDDLVDGQSEMMVALVTSWWWNGSMGWARGFSKDWLSRMCWWLSRHSCIPAYPALNIHSNSSLRSATQPMEERWSRLCRQVSRGVPSGRVRKQRAICRLHLKLYLLSVFRARHFWLPSPRLSKQDRVDSLASRNYLRVVAPPPLFFSMPRNTCLTLMMLLKSRVRRGRGAGQPWATNLDLLTLHFSLASSTLEVVSSTLLISLTLSQSVESSPMSSRDCLLLILVMRELWHWACCCFIHCPSTCPSSISSALLPRHSASSMMFLNVEYFLSFSLLPCPLLSPGRPPAALYSTGAGLSIFSSCNQPRQ